MNRETIIQQTINFVKETLADAEGGHDWWHICRVWQLSTRIAASEQASLFVVELGALLHDIADPKFHDGDETVGPQKARDFLNTMGVEAAVITHVENIIAHISFKGGNEVQPFKSPELDIVQDADRLDALGAIGIARAFHYGGFKNRELYNPDIKPDLNMTKEEYRQSTGTTINHFYEKLLLLKDRMNTRTGKLMAEQRHRFMETYLDEFYLEWSGEL
ncbi:MAG: HD domain-containing protein [Bacteroidota bacterium]|nr:HD domain-containing protein [Bacteroidota bacterium]